MTKAVSWDEVDDVLSTTPEETSEKSPHAGGALTPPDVEKPTRPALESLSRDQRRLVRSWIAGFSDRRELLSWCHEATVLTLGQLPPEWHRDRLMSLSELTTLVVVEEERTRWLEEDVLLSPRNAREWRLAIASTDVLPACQEALRKLRWSSVEYTDDATDKSDRKTFISVDDQEAPAMRPALDETSTRQRWVIDEALDGFASLDEIVETWAPVAIHASFGEVDQDLTAAFWRERPLREMFIEREDDAARWFRESFVALELLPAFNRAIDELSDRAGEAVSDGESIDHSALRYPGR